MNDSLIYPCLVHLMKILDQKQRNQPTKKPYYHAHIILQHFLQGRQLFNQQQQVFKVFLKYYRQNFFLKEPLETDILDTCQISREIQEANDKDKSVCQIVVRLLIIGIESLLSMDLEKHQLKEIITICEELHLALVFQGVGISQILMPFIQKLTNEIKNLLFLETLLKLFKKLDYFQIFTFLQRTIEKFRQEWNKTQQQIKTNLTKKKNRQSVFLPSVKRNVSMAEKQKIKDSNSTKQNEKETHKSKQKEKQPLKSTFKMQKTNTKPPPSNPRKSMYFGSSYKFKARPQNGDFVLSNQSFSFEETKFTQSQSFMIMPQSNLHYSSHRMKVQEREDDILADQTPEKKKKNKVAK